MNSMMTLDELQTEVARQADRKLELYTPAERMAAEVASNGTVVLTPQGKGSYPTTGGGFDQLCEYLRIPRDYARRCAQEQPQLLESQLNTWLRAKEGDERLVRVLDEQVRAICSPYYRILDHDKMLEVTLPIIEHLELDVQSCILTEQVLSIAVSSPKQLRPVGVRKVGDIVAGGFRLFNSETRNRGLRALYELLRLQCTNGMTVREALGSFSRSHRGGRLGVHINVPMEWKPTEDRAQSDARLWLEFGGQVLQMLDDERFQALTDTLERISDLEVDGDPALVMLALAGQLDLSKDETVAATDRLGHYLGELGNTRWAYVNAVTELANDRVSVDRALELEALGWQAATLSDRTWLALTASRN